MKNLIGMTFHRLSVIGRDKNQWLCKCECGTTAVARTDRLLSGRRKSCECLRKQIMQTCNISHGGSKTREYAAWRAMIGRCNYKKHAEYWRYGGRGIAVCDRWKSFKCFIEDMGNRPSPKHSLDRIDNNLGYSPENCRWATPVEQLNNIRRNRRVEWRDGRLITLRELSELLDLPIGCLRMRYTLGKRGELLFAPYGG